MRRLVPQFFIVVFVFITLSARGELKLPAAISDHMVLQRDKPATLWGWAAAGAEVSVKLDKQSHTARAGADGRWSVRIDPMPAGGPHAIIVSSDGAQVTVSDVLFGEVWVCSGQSNMQFSFQHGAADDAQSPATSYPLIRLFN